MHKYNRRKRFGQTAYQGKVNTLTGAMGPTRGAFWNSYTTTTGNPSTLGAQPLYYNPAIGEYVTSNAQASGPASINIYPAGTVNFSSGGSSGGSKFGKRRKSRRRRKRSKRRKSRRRKSRRSKRSKRSKRKSRRRRRRRRSFGSCAGSCGLKI